MNEIEERSKDFRRLGSFFKHLYWTNNEDEFRTFDRLYFHFDLAKLQRISNDIQYDSFEVPDPSDKNFIVQTTMSCLSKIVLNEFILEDNVYELVTQAHTFAIDKFSIMLKETNEKLLDVIKSICDDVIKDNIKSDLYIFEKYCSQNTYMMAFRIHHPCFPNFKIVFSIKK